MTPLLLLLPTLRTRGGGGLRQGNHLSVGCGVAEHLNLIVRAGHDTAIKYDDRSDRHLTQGRGFCCQAQSLAHAAFITEFRANRHTSIR